MLTHLFYILISDRPVRLRVQQPKRLTYLPAKSVMVATGSQPNTAFEYEHKGHFERSKGFYQGI